MKVLLESARDLLAIVVVLLVGIIRQQQRTHKTGVHQFSHQADPANLQQSWSHIHTSASPHVGIRM